MSGMDPKDLMLWGSVALALVTLYQMYRAQCLVTSAGTATAAAGAAVQAAAGASGAAAPFTQGRRRERMSQGDVPTYLDSMVSTREQQWDLLGAGQNQNMAAAYKGSGGLARSDRDSMVSYLEALKGNQTQVQTPSGKTCPVANFNNCPQNLAYQCENNKFWSDNAVSEALALSATGALNIPSMEETQLYDILRFSTDGVAPGCEGAAAGAGRAGFTQNRRGSRIPRRGGGKDDLLKLIH